MHASSELRHAEVRGSQGTCAAQRSNDKACVYGSGPKNFGCVFSSMHANTGMMKSGSGKLKGSEML